MTTGTGGQGRPTRPLRSDPCWPGMKGSTFRSVLLRHPGAAITIGLAREAYSCFVPDPLVSLISRNRNFLQGYDFAKSGLGDPVHLAGAGRALASEGPGLGHYGRSPERPLLFAIILS